MSHNDFIPKRKSSNSFNNRTLHNNQKRFIQKTTFSNFSNDSEKKNKQSMPAIKKTDHYLWTSSTIWKKLLQIQENFKRYKRELSRYQSDNWTVGEEINKSLIPKLKKYNVDTHQVVTSIYKGSDVLRTQERAATELYEQLSNLQQGEMSQDEAQQLLATTDEEAKGYALKALRLPSSLKHLETKASGKREAFNIDFLREYNTANHQYKLDKAASGYGGKPVGSFTPWSQYRGGKNYLGGRGHGASTFNNSTSHNPTYPNATNNPEHKQ
ncbi:hypothetical protein RO3G_14868 [Rhizopus delemar RA 99-880]|uniref:Uncharacterized protein n=1 Tax=Rhizopus delemar (strain RA 99-880 / ATCC MYA-4621 / FGSC 9543 / NRRL 43880) TaxID=246409 RepID=I1CNX7_RHIO9|nr:hypothetical protein RO3G_14868 [Rhizopus delemar RA 99-880]|eukprot:EIE90157.1 hypothetical protein RO3G_14868 [Rhizopus delemar RA 99-880]